MKNITVEQTRAKLKQHFFSKKFIPVFERIVLEETWWSPFKGQPRYIKHSGNFFEVTPTSIPKKLWPVSRVKRRRMGQLELPLLLH